MRVCACVRACVRAILCLNGLFSQHISDTSVLCCFITLFMYFISKSPVDKSITTTLSFP